MNVQVCSLLDQIEEDRNVFFSEGARRGAASGDYRQQLLVVITNEKSLFWIDYRTCQKNAVAINQTLRTLYHIEGTKSFQKRATSRPFEAT